MLQRPRKESFLAFKALILLQAPPRELFGWRMGGRETRPSLSFIYQHTALWGQFHH